MHADVWSLGVSIYELAMGRVPYSSQTEGHPLSVFDLLTMIVSEPPPRLPEAHFSPELVDLVELW